MTKDKLWWKNGIIYQIYPRSFQDSNADGIGDLQGIISRLSYLQDLGVDAIWLSPIYPSPNVDFGYDVANYEDISPQYGTMADFDTLVAEAHKRGLRVILDLVYNHSSDRHPWFIESQKSRNNPYHDWYIWRDPAPGGKAPNNWLSTFGGSAWRYNPKRGQYYYHMFTPEQPDLNWRNPAVRAALLGNMRFWLERGVDGFRLDVFNNFFKDPEFRDNPSYKNLGLRPFDWQDHRYDTAQQDMYPLLREMRSLLDEYPERYAVGETFLSDPAIARTYIGADLFHAGFNFNYTRTPWNARAFGNAIQYWDALHGDGAWPNWVLNNHDVPRSATRYEADGADRKLKLLTTMHLTLRGTPFLYYGEEIGMRDIKVTRGQIQDPVGRRYWPFYKGRDGCRSPMQWNAEAHAGFSPRRTWLKVNPDYPQRNLAAQKSNPNSLYHFYKALIALRKLHPALNSGQMRLLDQENPHLLVYEREAEDEKLLVALNFSIRPQGLTIPEAYSRLLFPADKREIELDARSQLLTLPGWEAAILAV